MQMSEDSLHYTTYLDYQARLTVQIHGQDLPCPQTDAVPGELAQQGNPVLSTLLELDSDLSRRSKDQKKVAVGVGATAAPAAEDSMPTTAPVIPEVSG